jgi:DNA-3-methyladenine glycosylase II
VTSASNRESAVALAAAHPALAKAVARYGPPQLPARKPVHSRFAALCESVIYQQLAGAAASAIHRRFVAACDGVVAPEQVAQVSFESLRDAGLSGSKATTVLGVAEAVLAGSLELDVLGKKPDVSVAEQLCKIRGIGPWTADMFLMFQLGRRDVWPVGDYAVRVGFTNLFGIRELIGPKELMLAGEPYSPHRSALAWYCWQAVDTAGRA